MIRFEKSGVAHLLDRKPCVRLQQFREVTLMIRRKVNNHDEGETAVRRYVLEKCLERRESPGRCADSNNGRLWFRWRLWAHASPPP